MKKQNPALEAAIAEHLRTKGVTVLPESRRVVPPAHWKFYVRGEDPPELRQLTEVRK
jgi:hypothetical protein